MMYITAKIQKNVAGFVVLNIDSAKMGDLNVFSGALISCFVVSFVV